MSGEETINCREGMQSESKINKNGDRKDLIGIIGKCKWMISRHVYQINFGSRTISRLQ